MSLPVHLVPDLSGTRAGDTVDVTGAEGHHAVAVRRLQVGEAVVLTDGGGRRARGAVTVAERGRLVVAVEAIEALAEPTPRLVVAQALAKGDRGELAVELLTELGVAAVLPWAASRCITVWRGDRAAKGVARWRATAREAAKQSRRIWFPEVEELTSTAQLAARIRTLVDVGGQALVLHEEAERGLAHCVAAAPREVLLIVGPEGGVSPEEIERLVTAGAQPVRLGAEVLRTSTAGAAAVAAILSHTPRWEPERG